MAELDVTANNIGHTRQARKYGQAITANQNTNTRDIAAMKAWLTANKPASYPTATLAKMTKNDLAYACLVEGLA
jgi:hypothetical protein